MRRLITYLQTAFRPATITDVIEHEMNVATVEIEQAKAVIHNHEFQLHMARARIAALIAWNAKHGGPQ